MPGLTIAQKYERLLEHIKSKGVRVYHRTFDPERQGNYETDGCYITIQSSIRGTVGGCYALAHEFGHWQQHRAGEFSEFFKNTQYSKRMLNLAYRAEQDAARRAKRLLWFYGLKCSPVELDTKQKKDLLKFYRKNYFID